MRSVKIATRHLPDCDNLPRETEEERIQRKFPEKEKKWLQPYIAGSSRDKVSDQVAKCSSEAKEGSENLSRKSVFSRLGRNASRTKHMAEHNQTSAGATLKDREERTPMIFGQNSKCCITNLHERNPQTESARRPILCVKYSSDVEKSEQITDKKPRACKHRIREEEKSRVLFQQKGISKFEDQQSEKRLIREVSKEANYFRSGSRIYGGLGRQTNWTWGEETCNAADEHSDTDETVLPEPQISLSTYETSAMANDVQKETESIKWITETAGIQKSTPNFQGENLLTDILTLSDEVLDDFDDSSSCKDSHQSDLERANDPEPQSVMDCKGREEPKHSETMDNISEKESAVNSELGLSKVKDLEEGEIVGDRNIKGVQITLEENEGEMERALHIKNKDSKSLVKNARDHFESDSWKSSKHRTNLHRGYNRQGSYWDANCCKEVYGAEKCQTLISLKRTRKRDLFPSENTRNDCNAKSLIRHTRDFQHSSKDVSSARTYLERDLTMPQRSNSEVIPRSNKPILSGNACRTSFRAVDIDSKKLERGEYIQCHVKPISSYRGKENAEVADFGCSIDVRKSNSSNQQSKSLSMEFKDKCSMKPSAKRELVLGVDESMQVKLNGRNLTDDKTKSVYDGQIEGSNCKVTAEKLPENEQMPRMQENSASPVHSWSRASKVAKLADGYPKHKTLRESANSVEDSCNAVMSRTLFVEDFSHKFTVKQQPCIQKRPKEEDAHRVNQRLRQINFGKNTLGYERYIDLVPRHKRVKSDPHTPDIHQVCSKRSWDGQVSKWRRSLHFYDPPVQEDEEFPEEIGVMRMTGLDIQDNEVCASLPAKEQVVKDSDLSIYGDWMDFGPADEQLFQETGGMDTMT
ncbi:hypothetical protein O6H91_05G086200 [Diphasiastrum complanatum]|uniref:Uncharacterized protein n=7 Tax=Diphasiastrum complanatum TaxID=34168 RepID=A0ACC2DRB0_DIPCM|nr:hypothetical protein O6H91_05G086200 [Diphasiastrum complanatum]KAJ7556501.1 hypothetical protein O6H91_05G086200 [Diphasiastrum complanatum]KAJ7556502.1 hypothetical protein O6H91_05G086200 [Diphasiastrum complanatum]KAJ7556503.1 hypothetical protein O6H91_05G086200 [Diphasiastrum complanatum]KAJ7556504.1 hypothetical protein O6H91_05G086200 [Diphasiastrum complanatum]